MNSSIFWNKFLALLLLSILASITFNALANSSEVKLSTKNSSIATSVGSFKNRYSFKCSTSKPNLVNSAIQCLSFNASLNSL